MHPSNPPLNSPLVSEISNLRGFAPRSGQESPEEVAKEGQPQAILVMFTLFQEIQALFRASGLTLPETNIAPENRPLEKEIPIGNHHF